MMTVVLPLALAGAVAFLVAISPIVAAVSVAVSAISTTEKVVTDVKADVAKRKARHHKKIVVKAPAKTQ